MLRTWLRRICGAFHGASDRATLTKRVPLMSTNPTYADYEIGEWSYGTPTVRSWGEGATLRVGKFCSFASGVTILLGGEHRPDWITTFPFCIIPEWQFAAPGHPHTKGDVAIGHDVWLGTEALILSGTQIGNGAVIGARSVVTGKVAPYEIVAGNPAKHVRFRFPQDARIALDRIAWWNWPTSKIREALPLMLAQDVEAFLRKYDSEAHK